MGRSGIFALFASAHRGDLYKCAGPTLGICNIFFFKGKDKCPTNAPRGVGDARGWNWLSHYLGQP